MKKILFAALLLFAKPVLSQNIIIKGATIYTAPGVKPISNGQVVIQNGKIISVGKINNNAVAKNTTIIDGKGLYLTAGFWNSHVHFTEPKWYGADTLSAGRLTDQLNDMVNSRGFTHVFDVGELDFNNLKAMRTRIQKGEVPGPKIRAVGVPLVPVGGSPFYIRPLKLPEIGDAATARQQVLTQVKAGAQGIKLFVASSNGKEVIPMNLTSTVSAVKTAHEYHLPVFAHPSTDAGVNIAITAGVDVLAHVAPDAHTKWGAGIVDTLIRKHIAVIPTLKMFRWSLITNGGDTTTDQLIPTALQQLNVFWKAGGTVLFGTDVGYMTDYDTAKEFELMHKAGLQFPDILRSLTTNPAAKFGFSTSSGKVVKNYDGDVVLLSADPAIDVKNFAKVKYTIVEGKITYHH